MLDWLNAHPRVKTVVCTLGGLLLYNLSLLLFLAGNNIAAGGVSGVAVILRRFVPLGLGTLMFLLNLPILLAAILINGWKYTAKTLVVAMLYSGSAELLSFLPTVTTDPLLASVFGGVVYGAGMAILSMGNASTGGTDLLSRLLVRVFPRMRIGQMSMLVDGTVVVAAMIAFQNVEVGMYAIVTIVTCSLVADRILMNLERGSVCMIITAEDAHRVADPLVKQLGLTATRVGGTGMYTDAERNVLFFAVRPREVYDVKKLLHTVDPHAFVILLSANEMIGGYFRSRYRAALNAPHEAAEKNSKKT